LKQLNLRHQKRHEIKNRFLYKLKTLWGENLESCPKGVTIDSPLSSLS
jgi:hypothetical protein